MGITLYELLTNFDHVIEFNLLKKLKIYSVSSGSEMTADELDVKEYYMYDVPLYLLIKKVFKVYHKRNIIILFK